LYFGEKMSRTGIRSDRIDFIDKYPNRTYEFDGSSLKVSLIDAEHASLRFEMAYRLETPGREKFREGKAEVTLEFRVSDSLISEVDEWVLSKSSSAEKSSAEKGQSLIVNYLFHSLSALGNLPSANCSNRLSC
ncbi:MAG: hypothetical protein KDN19_24050, partial [Verrucomicrobiae bacterium]|nr:hypothetical protein [Verrucomicrobiae bacterium]